MADSACQQTLPGAVSSAVQHTARVVSQRRMARDTYCLRLECPPIAEQILPGQFFMVRQPGTDDPLLGRPFALYDTYEENGHKAGVDFGYIVIGKLTSAMTQWEPDQPVEVWGPLGNGFPVPEVEHLALVAGGIGQTPFLAVAREALGMKQYGRPPRTKTAWADVANVEDQKVAGIGAESAERSPRTARSPRRCGIEDSATGTRRPQPPQRVTMCYGVRSAEYLAGLDDFRMEGLDLRISTDDGSQGRHGFVTGPLADLIENDAPGAVYCCGPEPMMKAVQQLCAAAEIPCWLSLETPMACGFGVCFSCVARVKVNENGEEWDYRRTCVEGPVFPAEQLLL